MQQTESGKRRLERATERVEHYFVVVTEQCATNAEGRRRNYCKGRCSDVVFPAFRPLGKNLGPAVTRPLPRLLLIPVGAWMGQMMPLILSFRQVIPLTPVSRQMIPEKEKQPQMLPLTTTSKMRMDRQDMP